MELCVLYKRPYNNDKEILYKSMLFMFMVFLFEMFYYMFKQMISVF
jgi:hypothetical protein